MQVIMSDPISLITKHGQFQALHFVAQEVDRTREGVVLMGNIAGDPVLVRAQSSCIFSESFWATDCDCALQLQQALDRVAAEGGLVIYLYDEGRGAGLGSKFKAIRLQQVSKMDTVQAYQCLEISPDMRSYDVTAAVLKLVVPGRPIVLLTNNPSKSAMLKKNGVSIVRCEPLIVGLEQPQIVEYLREKVLVLGHDIQLPGKKL